MKPSEQLRAAKALITNPAHWTQGYYATDEEGNECEALDTRATCFCSLGAVRKVGDFEDDINPLSLFLGEAVESFGYNNVDVFNDIGTHAEVLEMFDKAISLAEADEAKELV